MTAKRSEASAKARAALSTTALTSSTGCSRRVRAGDQSFSRGSAPWNQACTIEEGGPLLPLQGDTGRDLMELVRIVKGLPADPLGSPTDLRRTPSAEEHAPWPVLDTEIVEAKR